MKFPAENYFQHFLCFLEAMANQNAFVKHEYPGGNKVQNNYVRMAILTVAS